MLQKPQKLWIVAAGLLLVGLIIRSYLGIQYPSIYWPDEIFQTIEQAHRVVFGPGYMPWEYDEGLRSWVFPGLLAGLMWIGEGLGAGSRGYMGLVTVVMAAFSLIPAVVAWRWADRELDGSSWWPLLAMAIPLVWFELIYFGPKTFYETFTAHLAVGGIFLVRFADEKWWRAILGGAILGVCIISRPHLAPVAVMLGLAVPLFAERPHRRFSGLVVGVVLGAGLAGAVDIIAYGTPFQSLFVNVHTNVIQDKASQWGTSPKWQYLVWAWKVSPFGTLVLGAGLLVGVVRYPALGWPALAVALAHAAIPHKEYRFIYPAHVMGFTIAGIASARATRWLGQQATGWLASGGSDDSNDSDEGDSDEDAKNDKNDKDGASSAVSRAVGPVLAGLLVVTVCGFSARDGARFSLRSTGEVEESVNWRLQRGKILAYRYLSTREDICAVGRLGYGWAISGGHAYLHRDIPVVHLRDEQDLRNLSPSFDAFVAEGWDRKSIETFERVRCFQQICVYVRPGKCEDPPPGR